MLLGWSHPPPAGCLAAQGKRLTEVLSDIVAILIALEAELRLLGVLGLTRTKMAAALKEKEKAREIDDWRRGLRLMDTGMSRTLLRPGAHPRLYVCDP